MKKLDFTLPSIDELLIKAPQPEDEQVNINSLDYQE